LKISRWNRDVPAVLLFGSLRGNCLPWVGLAGDYSSDSSMNAKTDKSDKVVKIDPEQESE
jgi:hypothetical protein